MNNFQQLLKNEDNFKKCLYFLKESHKLNCPIVILVPKNNLLIRNLLRSLKLQKNCFFIQERWIGGTLTNWKIIVKLLKSNLNDLSINQRKKENLNKYLEGLRGLESYPMDKKLKIPENIIIIHLGTFEENIPMYESKLLGIPHITINDRTIKNSKFFNTTYALTNFYSQSKETNLEKINIKQLFLGYNNQIISFFLILLNKLFKNNI